MNQVFDGRETKHTPGPWKISHGGLPGDSGFSVASNNAQAENVKVTAECWPCTIVSEEHRQELFANARLIAAAPELLNALRALLATAKVIQSANESLRQNGIHAAGFADSLVTDAEAAIAKAMGE